MKKKNRKLKAKYKQQDRMREVVGWCAVATAVFVLIAMAIGDILAWHELIKSLSVTWFLGVVSGLLLWLAIMALIAHKTFPTNFVVSRLPATLLGLSIGGAALTSLRHTFLKETDLIFSDCSTGVMFYILSFLFFSFSLLFAFTRPIRDI